MGVLGLGIGIVRPPAPQNKKFLLTKLISLLLSQAICPHNLQMPQEKAPAPPQSTIPAPLTPGPGANGPLVTEAEAHPVVMYDAENPRSLINLVPERIREKIQAHLFDLENEPLFSKDEQALYKYLRENEATPSATDNRLRLKFWMEYDYCQHFHSKGIDIARVYAGICTYEYFRKQYLGNPKKVAWMLCPPTGYMVKANEALEFGMEEIRDILSAPHQVGTKVDPKLGELKLKITQFLHTVVKGAPVQRVVNAHLSGKQAAAVVSQSMTITNTAELDRQLNALKERERQMTNGGATVVVRAKPTEE